MIGIPFLSQIYIYSRIWMIVSTPLMVESKEGYTQVLDEKFIQFDWYPFILFLFSILFFGWLWSLSIGLQKWVPIELKMKTTRFKAFFFVPLIYIFFLISYMNGIFTGNRNPFFMNFETIAAVIVPLHLFSMFCIFHTIYFASKTIKTVELKRKVGFGDFISEFFLLWFYFIGIWVIQPKVNKLSAEQMQF
nr:hypothetical protein [uncultured Allomuricauda sp.]